MITGDLLKVTKNVKKRELRKHKKKDDDSNEMPGKDDSSDEEADDELQVHHRQSRMEIEETEDDYDLLSGIKKRPVMPEKTKTDGDDGISFSADGKLIIKDLAMSSKRKRSEEDDDEGTVDDDEDFIPVAKEAKKIADKAKPSTKGVSCKYKHGGKGIHRDPQMADVKTGVEYKSKKGKGDSKKKGQSVDPFAYYPLLKSSLNKRKRAAMSGQFKELKHKKHKSGRQ